MAEQIERRIGSKGMQAEITALTEEIAALGPVNLAALSELDTARERKTFLDARPPTSRRRSRRWRRRSSASTARRASCCQDTFEHREQELQEMFPALFGGGQASLKLTARRSSTRAWW
jgi:chromosome segregation protein